MENFPELPKLVIPDSFSIPAPPLQYPGVELLKFDPIFVPQRVKPGSIQDYLQKLAEQEQEENLEEENPQEEQKDRKEQTKPQDKAENKGTSPPQIPPSPALPPIQTTPIELPSLVEDEDDSIPEPELEGVITVQVLGIPIPMPEPEILVAAGATATVSVAATLASTSILKKVISIMKPLIKKIMTLALKKFGKKPPKSWARERLEQRQSRRLKTG
tara:strand:+ start:1541 stop:2188 length:648 start_codon:yes stop_codon:yes gene_type:complete